MKLLGGVEEGSVFQKVFFAALGVILVLLIWSIFTMGSEPLVTSGILPSPKRVLFSFGDLFTDNELLKNAGYSIGLNLAGYLEAILIALPVGFIIGLFKYTRWGFQRQVDSIRYIPLTAVTGLFIVWFGIGGMMKIHFLAFGILIYLLPIMIQRIDEVGEVYLKTVHTLGATDWQTIRTVYFPSVVSRLSDDIRVLTAISWTYIIVAEGIGSQGGIGDLIWKAGLRQGRVDKVFALLIVIMVIGIVQDKIFIWLDRSLFPYKYQARDAVKSSALQASSFVRAAGEFALFALSWIVIGLYLLLFLNEYLHFLGAFQPLSYLFGETLWVIHLMFFSFLGLKGWSWYRHRSDQAALQHITAKGPSKK